MSQHVTVDPADPHTYDHTHANVSGGWLRASVFGAMDGLVSNIGLVTGIGAAGASNHVVLLTGVSGLLSGAFSMALGEFTSVRSQNEQLDKEVAVEIAAQRRNPAGEQAELAHEFQQMGMSEQTARQAVAEIHGSGVSTRTVHIHLTQELGIDPDERPSPVAAGMLSFLFFSMGAIVPILPYLLGVGTLWTGLAAGCVGLLVAGGLAAKVSGRGWLRGAVRQLLLGMIAVGVAYIVGALIGVETA
ncbi:MAG: VIT1/CCC1 family putative Fe2+/Mn2+ transporter [Pseudoclavibacter caeni]|jgi:vacuolar iron transporter family protein